MDGTGNILSYYVYDGMGLVAKMSGSNVYYYHYDGLGSTIAMTDSSGNMVNKYSYDEFGNLVNTVEAVPNPFTYVGQYGVVDDDNGLIYMRARYYDPEVGRFINKDPIGYEGGDVNLFCYAANNPANAVDPSGLINITKTGVGIISMGRGIYAAASGAASAIIGVAGIHSGVGWPLGISATVLAAYNLGIGAPGLMKRGVQQITEGLNECPGKISFGSWDNLLGLGFLGQYVDDPGETYREAIEFKIIQYHDIDRKIRDTPHKGLLELLKWLQDWTM
jgi:RHS repeat-associated protein